MEGYWLLGLNEVGLAVAWVLLYIIVVLVSSEVNDSQLQNSSKWRVMSANNHKFRLFFRELVTKIVIYKKFSRTTENVFLASTKLRQDFIEVFFVEKLDQVILSWSLMNESINRLVIEQDSLVSDNLTNSITQARLRQRTCEIDSNRDSTANV